MFKIIFISLILHNLPTETDSSVYYGLIQYTDESSGVSFIVFQEADSSKKFCEDLNKNYIRGLRTTCSTCVIELDSCNTSLPSAFTSIFQDEPLVVPYLSAPYTRIVVFGVEFNQAKTICNEMAARWREGMNQPARCISQ
jgi:hypothetical protein